MGYKVNVIVIRHGQKDSSGQLTAEGREQVRRTVQANLELFGQTKYILHDGQARMKDTAAVIQEMAPHAQVCEESWIGVTWMDQAQIAELTQKMGVIKKYGIATLQEWDIVLGALGEALREKMIHGINRFAGSAPVIVVVTNEYGGLEVKKERAEALPLGEAECRVYQAVESELGFDLTQLTVYGLGVWEDEPEPPTFKDDSLGLIG